MKKGDWNKLLEMWSRGNPEEESSMVEEREPQQHKKLAHSIEEILRRPTCVKKETKVFRNWSVIKENTRTSSGIFLAFFFLALVCKKEITADFLKPFFQ